MKHCYRYVMIFVILMLCSCAYALQAKHANIRAEFDQSMKGYNKMLRWREVENAGMAYMDPELRDAFMKTADVVADFDYYTLPSNRIKTLTYRQNWKYLDTEEKKGWQLKTGLPPFD